MMRKDIRCVSVIFDRHVDVWRDQVRHLVSCIPHGLDSFSLRSSHDISRDLDQRISASLQRDSARVIPKRAHLFASRDTPSAPLSDDWWPVWKDRCHLVHFDWLKRVQRLRFCQLVDVILSRSTVRLPASLSHLFTFSWPLLVLASLVFRTRSVGFWTGPNGLLSTFRCYGHIVRFDSFIFPDIFFDVVYAWRLEYVERFPDLGLSIITKWVPRFVVFGIFGVAALSQTDGFVMSTLDCLLEQVRWRLRRGGPARISSVTICRFYRGVRVRSIVIVHCRCFFSPCRWATTLMRTESGR